MNKRRLKRLLYDWVKAFAIALIIIILMRLLVFQTIVVTTTNMERTLLQGDYVIINKLTYGPRFPMTIINIPFIEKKIPILNIPSYSTIISLPYWRMPAFYSIKRNDIIAFNYPLYNDLPIDRKPEYVKRCVALPGDTLQIIRKKIYINGRALKNPIDAQFNYRVITNGTPITPELLKKYAIREGTMISSKGVYDFQLTTKIAEQLANEPNITTVRILEQPKEFTSLMIFPNSPYFMWNIDYFGPFIIPKKNTTVELSVKNIALYQRIIELYEQKMLEFVDKKIYINGIESPTYTFKQNYYFVMDDNRDNCKDSRFWGVVPENHIIGKVCCVFFSIDKDKESYLPIRWNRIFHTIK